MKEHKGAKGDKPDFAPSLTKEGLEAEASPREKARGQYTEVSVLENDTPSGEETR